MKRVFRPMIVLSCGIGFTISPAHAKSADVPTVHRLSVMNYNVKGLPWPIAHGRPQAFKRIAQRLRALRWAGKEPQVVVLQEAFTREAKTIGSNAGYRYMAAGPTANSQEYLPMTKSDRRHVAGADWRRGETQGKLLDSGLQILSDYPIVAVRRAAFPSYACAGYDCLANKGVLLVTISVPGLATPVAIATSHLNSRRTSGVSSDRSLYAYSRQIDFLRDFFAANRSPNMPLIFAGDFNVGKADPRRARLLARIGGWWSGRGSTASREGLRDCLPFARSGRELSDARRIVSRARDWQFITSGRKLALSAAAFSVPFGFEHPEPLSDHFGYTVHYRFTPPGKERSIGPVTASVNRIGGGA